MNIIPAINCQDFSCVNQRIKQAKRCGASWVQIDVADGSFTSGYSTWRNPDELKNNSEFDGVNIELHLMVSNSEEVIATWLSTDIKRLIFHIESTKNVNMLVGMCRAQEIEPMLAINPETEVEDLIPHLNNINFCQLLAVSPGKSGQEFDKSIIKKIKKLKKEIPQIKIEIDGGINFEIAKECINAGADQLAVGSFIFNSENPEQQYKKLVDIC